MDGRDGGEGGGDGLAEPRRVDVREARQLAGNGCRRGESAIQWEQAVCGLLEAGGDPADDVWDECFGEGAEGGG